MTRRFLTACVGIVIATVCTSAEANVPDLIPVQGVLADDLGDPLDGSYQLAFALYDGETAGTEIWSDTFGAVDVDEGFFTVYLGAGAALNFTTLLGYDEIWLGLTVESDPEMTRVRFASVPFAQEALVCERVGSLTETDINNNFLSSSSPAAGIAAGDITNWNTAYGWGDHSAEGYLTSFTETDPVYAAGPAAGIAASDIANWNTAYGWGDHSTEGYLTSYSETDPVYSVAPASGITSGNITNWNTSYGWGDHSTQGYLTSYTETDPVYSVAPASGITSGNITNWNTSYGWGDHSTQGYLTSYSETDPVYSVAPASGITSGNITNWNTAYGWGDHSTEGYLTSYSETDPKVGTLTSDTVPKWGTTELVDSTIFDDGSVGIGTTAPAATLDVNGDARVATNAVIQGEMIRTVQRNAVNVWDQTTNAIVASRTFDVMKLRDDTTLRIQWYDNFRCTGVGVACRWDVLIDGQPCQAPGPIRQDYYNAAGPGGVNNHYGQTVFGYCSILAGDVPILAGPHQITVFEGGSPGHVHGVPALGWNWADPGTTATMEVEEVF